MQLTTLVEILRTEIPGLTERASARRNLSRLFAERGLHDQAAAELQGAGPGSEAEGPRTLEASVALAASLARAGRLDEAKREARRILAAGDVPPSVSTQLRRILVRSPGHEGKRLAGSNAGRRRSSTPDPRRPAQAPGQS